MHPTYGTRRRDVLGGRRLGQRSHGDRTRILHDLDVFANQRADVKVLRFEPIEGARLDRHRHEMDDAKQRNELRH